jgi:para-nitrobenzyl esterase
VKRAHFIVSLLLAACVPREAPDPCTEIGSAGTVDTEEGDLRGQARDGVCRFLGVPYAPAPVGARRWEPPARISRWRGVRDASAFGPPCPQLAADGSVVGDEDCLYLNVWAPPLVEAKPVLVFFHGGGNLIGSSSERYYDGALLAALGNVVVVTADYRLGPLGYLALEGLSPDGIGNYGVGDARAVLAWMQRNIGVFQGDPKRVLAFGQSAGARNLCALMGAGRGAEGLFRAAVLESGACEVIDHKLALDHGARFVAASGCGDGPDPPACLRQLDVRDVLTTLPDPSTPLHTSVYNPIDSENYWSAPLDSFYHRASVPVPTVVGVNAEEAGYVEQPLADATEYALLVQATFGAEAAVRILAVYPASDYATPREAWAAIVTDRRYVCPARTTATVLSDAEAGHVYRYLFTQRLSREPERSYGSFHGVEIPYLFRTFDAVGYMPTREDLALSDAMIGYWSRFAAMGNPNGDAAPEWPAANPQTDPYLVLGTPIESKRGLRTERCDFWRSL